MERSCEFCVSLRPVVFCEADAAHLCLPCDSKVHSANALSKRHPRIHICEFCRNRPAYVRCADHQKFMCRGCDHIHHDHTSEHKTQVITTYTGCPSAKELAEEWGFDLSDLESSTLFASHLNINVEEDNVNALRQLNSQIRGSPLVSSIESLQSSVSEVCGGLDNSCIKHVEDLRKLHLAEGSYKLSKVDQERVDASSTIDNSDWKMNDNGDRHAQNPDFQLQGNLGGRMKLKPYPSLFSQVDQLVAILNEDSCWQSKSLVESNQLWYQNMQDLGVCDELRSMDDLSMPDFDLTFQNYEELFKGEEEPKRAPFDDKISAPFDPSIDFTESQEHSCNSNETEGLQSDSLETVFIRHKDKKGNRHEKQAVYTSHRKVKSDAMKRVKGKVRKAEGSGSQDANDVMSRNY